jgi:hypothetical protein
MKHLFLIGLLCLGLAACGNSGSANGGNPTHEAAAPKLSAAQKLAALDAGGPVAATDEKVLRMNTLLQQLADTYSEPADSIAAMTSRAQGVIQEYGAKETNLSILEDMAQSGKADNTPYRDAIVLYAMTKAQGAAPNP